jgi:hypothetical protein
MPKTLNNSSNIGAHGKLSTFKKPALALSALLIIGAGFAVTHCSLGSKSQTSISEVAANQTAPTSNLIIPPSSSDSATTTIPAQKDSAKALIDCFKKAYPQTVSNASTTSELVLNNGKKLALGDETQRNFQEQLNHASLFDQVSQHYPLDFSIPAENFDPGRIRNDAFFSAMYGASSNEIQARLESIVWQPSGQKIMFNKINGAAQALQNAGQTIAADASLAKYVQQTLGTFNYRNIAGTKRLSNHSYGIAIDFKLPAALHKYWQWDGCKENQTCAFPTKILQDENLQKVVSIFEKNGFIWGGKWYHYDSVHFEYRPELLEPNCHI